MDYKKLYLEQQERLKQEQDLRKQAENKLQQEHNLRQQDQVLKKQAEDELQRQSQQSQKTAFEEFIETDRRRTAKGLLTSAAGRLCPTYLRPWSDFHTLQQRVFESVYTVLHPPDKAPLRLFPSRPILKEIGDRVCSRPLSSEVDLVYYERNTVEDQVYKAITSLRGLTAALDVLGLEDEITFYNNSSAFDSDPCESAVVDSLQQKQSVGDNFCVRCLRNGVRTRLYTIEYKPAHKLSVEHLRYGLREMKFWEEVVQRVTIPTEPEEKFKYDAEQMTGAAVSQVYNGIIHDGLAYACLTNGYCKVFFHISEDHPEILYYFFSEPNVDVRDRNDKTWLRQPITAVGRMLSFCLMTNDCLPRSQTEMSATTMHSTPVGSEYITSSSSVSSPPIKTQSRRYNLRSRHCCGSNIASSRTSADSSDSDSSDASPGTGGKRKFTQLSSLSGDERARGSKSTKETGDGEEHIPHTSWQYCTQSCLIGLRNKGRLDVRCPNEWRHRRGQISDRHIIDDAGLVRLIKQQLDKDLDNHCTPLGKVGIRGALFKQTLFSYGYTFVGKGTTDRLWTEVRNEADVYRALQKAQGSAVPVFLGTIDLKMTYFLQGGEQANLVKEEKELWGEIRRSVHEIRELGVQHEDLHWSNILGNSQVGRVQIIDFHRSKLLQPQIRRLKMRHTNV
ncbi:reticulocyte-binding protein 2 like a [Lipomyces starkeyi]